MLYLRYIDTRYISLGESLHKLKIDDSLSLKFLRVFKFVPSFEFDEAKILLSVLLIPYVN